VKLGALDGVEITEVRRGVRRSVPAETPRDLLVAIAETRSSGFGPTSRALMTEEAIGTTAGDDRPAGSGGLTLELMPRLDGLTAREGVPIGRQRS